jgi:predicted RNase H-like HicB family nuclease
MKRRFQVTIERRGDSFEARCPELSGVEGHGKTTEEAIENIRAAIRQKLGGGSGSAENDKRKD